MSISTGSSGLGSPVGSSSFEAWLGLCVYMRLNLEILLVAGSHIEMGPLLVGVLRLKLYCWYISRPNF